MIHVRISAIAAISDNRALGKDNKLLFKIPEDFERMKHLSMGHPIIMGRKTFESIGRPLPGRLNVVITRDTDWKAEGITVVYSLDNAIQECIKYYVSRIKYGDEKIHNTKYIIHNTDQEIFIFGGGQIYKEAMPKIDRLYLTIVHKNVEADTFFPDYSEFKKVIEKKDGEFEGLKYTFLTLER